MRTNYKKSDRTKSREDPLTQRSRFGWMPLVVVLTLLINLILTFRLNHRVGFLANNKPYIYVQKVDGEIAVSEAADELHRSDKVIQQFTEDWLKTAYAWQIKDPKQFVTENNINYPLPLYFASLAIAPDYREAYLTAIAKKYSEGFRFDNYISGTDQSYIRIFQKPVVESIEPGVWDVTIIAYRTHAKEDSIFAEEQFNRVLRVRAIEPGDEPTKRALEQADSSTEETALEQQMKNMQNKGLQIIKITSV